MMMMVSLWTVKMQRDQRKGKCPLLNERVTETIEKGDWLNWPFNIEDNDYDNDSGWLYGGMSCCLVILLPVDC